MPFWTTAAIVGAGLAGSLGGSAIASSAAGHAADTQASAAEQAAQLNYKAQQDALKLQESTYNQNLSLASPYYSGGLSGLTNLLNLMGIMPKSYSTTPIPSPQPLSVLPGDKTTASAPPTNGDWSSGDAGVRGVPGGRFAPVQNNGDFRMRGPVQFPSGAPGTPGAVPPTSNTAMLSSLVNPSLGTSGSLLKPFGEKFTAPTLSTTTDPGYLARLKLATDTMQNSAAAKGNLLTGGTLRDLNQFTQDYASNEYSNVYNRANQAYAQRYNIYEGDQANTYNRLAAIAGIGQTTANQLGTNSTNTAANMGNIFLGGANTQGNLLQNAAAARGSGYAAGGNIWGNAFSGIGSNIQQLMMLQQLLQSGGTGISGGNAVA